MNKIVGYARLSTREQALGSTFEQQISRLHDAGAEEIYQDLESGTKDNRRDFQRLIQDAQSGGIKKIICTRLDRFSRKMITAVQTIQDLHNKGIEFSFLDNPLPGLDSAFGKANLNQIALFAQWESDLTSERVRHGKNYEKSQGQVTGGHQPYAYVINSQKKYELDKRPFLCLLDQRPKDYNLYSAYYDELYNKEISIYDFNEDKYVNWQLLVNDNRLPHISKADIARDLILKYMELKSGAASLREIYLKYGIPTRVFHEFKKLTKADKELIILGPCSVTNWLRNPTLRGHTPYFNFQKCKGSRPRYYHIHGDYWEVKQNTHPEHKLMTDEEYELVEVLLYSNTKSSTKSSKYKYFYSGLIYCAECQSKLTTKRGGNGYRYYACRGITCSNKTTIREDDINRIVSEHIFERALLNETSTPPEGTATKSETLIQLEKRLERTLQALLEDPYDPELLKCKETYQEKIRLEIQSLGNQEIWDQTAQDIIHHPALRDIGFIYSLNHDNRRIIYHKLIKSISVLDGTVKEIKLKV